MSWFEGAACLSASVYNNNSLNTKVVTSREFPKYQVEEKPIYQLDSPKKEMNIKLFLKADTLIDDILSCQRTEPWNSRTLIFQGAMRSTFAGLCPTTASWKCRCSRQLLQFFLFTLPYFILLDAAGLSPVLVPNQNTKANERGSCVPLTIWWSEVAEVVHTRCCCLWASRFLVSLAN